MAQLDKDGSLWRVTNDARREVSLPVSLREALRLYREALAEERHLHVAQSRHTDRGRYGRKNWRP